MRSAAVRTSRNTELFGLSNFRTQLPNLLRLPLFALHTKRLKTLDTVSPERLTMWEGSLTPETRAIPAIKGMAMRGKRTGEGEQWESMAKAVT